MIFSLFFSLNLTYHNKRSQTQKIRKGKISARNLRANKPHLGRAYFGISRECDAPCATIASVTGVVISDVGPR